MTDAVAEQATVAIPISKAQVVAMESLRSRLLIELRSNMRLHLTKPRARWRAAGRIQLRTSQVKRGR